MTNLEYETGMDWRLAEFHDRCLVAEQESRDAETDQTTQENFQAAINAATVGAVTTARAMGWNFNVKGRAW